LLASTLSLVPLDKEDDEAESFIFAESVLVG
jgi:hypothetical protein